MPDCEFSDWHSWQGMCVNDQKVRWRVVQQPATNGGASCCGPIKETRPCSAMEGPDIYLQDGDASPWSSWSSCTRRCGGGLRTRKRRVEVEAKNGGYPFCGPLEVMEPCNQDPCAEGDGVEGDNCELTNWDNWSPCTESNIQYRNRQIAKDAKLGGVPCEDGLRMVRECTSAGSPSIDIRKNSGGLCGLSLDALGPVHADLRRRPDLPPPPGEAA
ncbi:unnamed protein product [Effrenium voratum]|uniref:Spondin-like TSP1 domain-containing protein n=1 Tax=Effrenium voratum TaxID=2562239 RepID=A0AA36N1S2_9DINO|nr:unnamed protein product [Effrenium voratum]